MRKKLYRLIAMMLVATMALSSVIVVNAEGNTTATTSEGVTSQTANPADTDEHYREAIGFLAYLEIFQGDENGDMKPEETITRAEIAAIILREMNVLTMSTYNDTFSDVDTSHWAADVIQTAYDNGIINGYDDGTFGPDDDVTYEQAVKMIVCAVNYGTYALAYGEYPSGYLYLADQKDILDHIDGKIGESVSRRTVAKLVYNSLTIDYPVVDGYKDNSVQYNVIKGITILSEKRDIYYKDGIITAAPGKSWDLSKDLLPNQIAIEDEVMQSEIENAEQYVAEYARVFYREDDDLNTAVYVIPLSSKTKSIVLNADEIEDIVTGYEGGTPSITYYKNNTSRKEIDLVNQPIIVYNDQPFTMYNYNSLNLSGVSFDEFITPVDGSVRAVDFTQDGDYDILFVENYETSVVKIATTKRIQIEYPISIATNNMLELDTQENDDLTVTVIRDGEECALKDLKEGDVISVRANANFSDSEYTGSKRITIEASLDYIDGTVTGVTGEAGDYYATIDDTEYKVLDSVITDVQNSMGSKGKFYLNKFGTISFVESGAIGGLSSGEKYGWLINVYTSNSGEESYARLYTSDGEVAELPLASAVDFWAADATTNRQATASEIDALIDGTSSGFLNCKATDVSGQVSIRLCKFRTNSKNEIIKLYLAVDESTVSETSNAVRVATKDHKDSVTRGGLFDGRYYIREGVPQMTVPLSADGMRDAANYGYRIAGTSEFSSTAGENGLGYNCFFADVSDAAPGVMIKMVKSVTEAMDVTEYVTADDNPVILISSIGTGVDEDGDTTYIINGYREGEKVRYVTAKNVLVAQVNETPRLSKEYYSTTTIWTKDSAVKLTDVLHPGDICGIDGSASSAGIILRMVDTTGLAKHWAIDKADLSTVPAGQFKYDEMFSPTRDRVIFGQVTDIRTSPIVQYDITVSGSDAASSDEDNVTTTGATTISIGITNIDRPVQYIYISKSGSITVEKEVSDAYEVEVDDYVFIRNFKNDAEREMYVIRYE